MIIKKYLKWYEGIRKVIFNNKWYDKIIQINERSKIDWIKWIKLVNCWKISFIKFKFRI